MTGLSSSDMNDSDVGSNVSTEYMTWASAHFSSHLMRLFKNMTISLIDTIAFNNGY